MEQPGTKISSTWACPRGRHHLGGPLAEEPILIARNIVVGCTSIEYQLLSMS